MNTAPLNPIAECCACRHAYAEADELRCKLFKCLAELPCARFEREPGSDDGLVFMGEGIGWVIA